ncbi:MAG: asparagine synthase (glutamine-hydrolyzing) [Gammaproteobacteria bacterium]|jgi:asparagine synthase (glutamine-hydrolysing)
MSGLCGVFTFDGAPLPPGTVDAMVAAAVHRGPGGVGRWRGPGAELAQLTRHPSHERPAACRPAVSETGSLVVSADVRLDNREVLIRSLRDRGDIHAPDPSDADLILAAYRVWGEQCAGRLLGDFAFVIWEPNARRLFAARDPMGMRPLFYRFESACCLVGSEIKQILAVPGVQPTLIDAAVAGYLEGGITRKTGTLYEGIFQLAPGNALIVDAGRLRTWRYWDIDPGKRIRYRRESEYAEHFREVFKEAVSARVRTEQAVGVSLSGGLDSGSVASMAGWLREQGDTSLSRVRAYCAAFEALDDSDERYLSTPIIDAFHLESTNVWGDNDWPLSRFPEHGPDRDDPAVWPFQPLIEHIARAAHWEGMQGMLTGDRGDEVVGAWNFDHLGLLFTGQFQALSEELRAQSQEEERSLLRVVRSDLLRPFAHRLGWRNPASPTNTARHTSPPWLDRAFLARIGRDPITALHLDTTSGITFGDLATQRRYELLFSSAVARNATLAERTHARFGLGYADPWADRRVAEFVLAVPQWVVNQVRTPKRLAREAMRGILPEPTRLAAAKIEPISLYERGMKERARETVFHLITDSRAAALGYIDEAAWRGAYESFLRGEPQHYDIWWPITFEMWLRRHW